MHRVDSAANSKFPQVECEWIYPSRLGGDIYCQPYYHYRQKYPKLELSITFNDRATDLFNDGIDLAVRVGQLGDTVDLVARRLGEQRRVICASPAYFARLGTPKDKADLSQHQCIVGWPLGQQHRWLLKNEDGIIEAYDIPVRHEIADCEAILAATLAGVGLAQVPIWLVEDYLKTGELISVLDELASDDTPIHLIWLKTPYLQPQATGDHRRTGRISQNAKKQI